MLVRSLTINLIEDNRSCEHCRKTLTGEDHTVYILAPPMNRAFEFCSWYCLYKFLVSLLKAKILSRKLVKTDMLSQLGVDLKWGADPKERLDSEIVDPIEDMPHE